MVVVELPIKEILELVAQQQHLQLVVVMEPILLEMVADLAITAVVEPVVEVVG